MSTNTSTQGKSLVIVRTGTVLTHPSPLGSFQPWQIVVVRVQPTTRNLLEFLRKLPLCIMDCLPSELVDSLYFFLPLKCIKSVRLACKAIAEIWGSHLFDDFEFRYILNCPA